MKINGIRAMPRAAMVAAAACLSLLVIIVCFYPGPMMMLRSSILVSGDLKEHGITLAVTGDKKDNTVCNVHLEIHADPLFFRYIGCTLYVVDHSINDEELYKIMMREVEPVVLRVDTRNTRESVFAITKVELWHSYMVVVYHKKYGSIWFGEDVRHHLILLGDK